MTKHNGIMESIMQRLKWEELYMSMAYLNAMRSPDPSTRLGVAVVDERTNQIVSGGYNGWPRGIAEFSADDIRWQRPEKYYWMEHAERNAIYNAGRLGIPVVGCTMFSLVLPCADCARAIIQSGIKRLVVDKRATDFFVTNAKPDQVWLQSVDAALQMLEEAGIQLDLWEGEVVSPKTLLCGQVFDPATPMLIPGTTLTTIITPSIVKDHKIRVTDLLARIQQSLSTDPTLR